MLTGEWPADLTFAENVKLAAGLYGGLSQTRRAETLAMGQQFGLADHEQLRNMTLVHRQLANLLIAFLPRPEYIFVPDLTTGLSDPAGQALWSHLVTVWQRGGGRLVYVSENVQLAAQLPAGEVWLANGEGAVYRWPFDQLPPLLQSPRHYLFEFQTSQAVVGFRERLAEVGTFYRCLSPKQVQIISDNSLSLVDLTLMAGLALARFESRPVTVADLPLTLPAEAQKIALPKIATAQAIGSGRERLVTIAHIARYQWQWHFRQFWRAGNFILTAPYNLIFLLPMLQLGQYHLAMAVCAAAMSLLWGCPAGQHYFGHIFPFWRQIYRGPVADLGLGYGLGQLGLALAHNGLFWLGFVLLWPAQFGLAVVLWLLTMGLAIAVAAGVGRAVGGSGRALGIGFGLFLLIFWLVIRW